MIKKFSYNYLKSILKANFTFISERSTEDELVIICPEEGCQDKTGNRSFNVHNGKTNCWRCNKGYSTEIFFKKHDIDVENNSFEILTNNTILDSLSLDKITKNINLKFEQTKLPQGFTKLSKNNSSTFYYKAIKKMAERKNLTIEDFIDYGVGFTREGDWERYAIFPVFENNRIVYYQGRTYILVDEKGSTKKFPNRNEALGSSNFVYNIDAARQKHVQFVIVVESILNVISLNKIFIKYGPKDEQGNSIIECIAIFKHAISKPQVSKILSVKAPEICILFDGDATNCAYKEGLKLSRKKVTIAEMPVGIDANDNAELAAERFLERKVLSPVLDVFNTKKSGFHSFK